MSNMLIGCSIVCVMIVLDIVSGVINAFKQNELSSTAAREGLYNKSAELLLMATAFMCNKVLAIYPFNEMGIPPEVLYCVLIYLFFMELLSVIENICKINPNIPISKLLDIFNITIDSDNDDMVSSKKEQDL